MILLGSPSCAHIREAVYQSSQPLELWTLGGAHAPKKSQAFASSTCALIVPQSALQPLAK